MQVSREAIGSALDWEINDWRERQINALEELSLPFIGSDGFSQGMAWLNFGVDATKTLFPDLAQTLGSILAGNSRGGHSHTVMMWILGKAQDGFETIYESIIEQQNHQLEKRYLSIRDNFVRQVQRAARGFSDSQFGRGIIDQIQAYLGSREFRDSERINHYCRELVQQAGLIVTDPATIRRLTEHGFGTLCRRIRDIYLGSYHALGNNAMMYAGSPTLYIWEPPQRMGVPTTRRGYREVYSRREQDSILAHAWQMEANHVDVWPVSTYRDTTYVRRVQPQDRALRLPETYRGPVIDLRTAESRMPPELRQ